MSAEEAIIWPELGVIAGATPLDVVAALERESRERKYSWVRENEDISNGSDNTGVASHSVRRIQSMTLYHSKLQPIS